MNVSTTARLLLPWTLLVLLGASAAGQRPGVSREQMWPAPTEEDWKKPCLLTFQRTWEDALHVAREEQRPILICVNMDGEIASEHYAGIRYRSPEIAKLYEPYVCVIASVYRHNMRDYDEHGHRIPCPRFGSVTCGEHIAIEPVLYEKFFEGERVAPRHIGVELDGKETYDVYYAFDTQSVFQTIVDGVAGREFPPRPTREDQPLDERMASREMSDRTAVEQAYTNGNRETRKRLLRKALEHPGAAQVDLLRLAIFDFDVELNKLARAALADANDPKAIDLINESLRVSMDASEREALIRALEGLGEATPRARTLAAVHRGLEARSQAVDVEGWSREMEAGGAPVKERRALETKLEYVASTAGALPDDPGPKLDMAEASIELAVDPRTVAGLGAIAHERRKYSQLLFEDALRAAREAEELGAEGWRVDAAIALASYYLGDTDEGFRRAERAVEALPSGEQRWNAMGVLALFAESRRRSIWEAVRDKKKWPSEWVTDVHAAYSVLAKHPLGTEQLVIAHYDFLRRFGAAGQAGAVLDAGLARYPESFVLHDRLRGRILNEKGVDALEPTYEAMLKQVDAAPNLPWFAGYTSIVAAEFHRRKGDYDKALQSYGRSVTHYDAAIEANPEVLDSADHYAALALAGSARLLGERGELERAVNGILASFTRCQSAAASLDGLNITPVGTARMLLANARTAERDDLADRIQQALDAMPPELLELPEFERGGPRPGQGRAGQGRGPR